MENKTTWTVLVYMVADTGDSFYQAALYDIAEMMKAEFDERVRVIVHTAAPSPWQTKCWKISGTHSNKGQPSEKIYGEAEEIPCSHTSLLDFVEKSVRSYPSDRYLFVLWGHGEGIDWKQKVLAGPSSPDIERKRFAPGSQNALEIGELGTALAGLDWGDLNRENVIVGFDACLMGMAEVYEEIWKYVGWGVAAADEIPDTGWPYTDVLQVLGNRPDIPPKELAGQIVNVCVNWYSENSPDTKISFAACDLLKSTDLLKSMTALTKELSESVKNPSVRKAVTAARDFAEDLQEVAYVDFYAFCEELMRQTQGKVQQLYSAAYRVTNVLDIFVFKHQFSDSYPYKYEKDARALSICFPKTRDLVGSVANIRVNWGSYKDLTFSKNTHWPDFLVKYWEEEPPEDYQGNATGPVASGVGLSTTHFLSLTTHVPGST